LRFHPEMRKSDPSYGYARETGLFEIVLHLPFAKREKARISGAVKSASSPTPVGDCVITVILINMKAMYFAVGRLTGEGGRAVWNTSPWTFIRSTPGHE
jgi:hypothetical protein